MIGRAMTRTRLLRRPRTFIRPSFIPYHPPSSSSNGSSRVLEKLNDHLASIESTDEAIRTSNVVNKLSDISDILKTLDKRDKETRDTFNEQFKTLDKRMKEIEKKKFWALI